MSSVNKYSTSVMTSQNTFSGKNVLNKSHNTLHGTLCAIIVFNIIFE
jgi:hypothetical protein